MAVVTKIEQQKNNPDRYSVVIDGEYAFGLSSNDLLASGLHQGISLTPAEIDSLKSASERSKVYHQALSYLSYRKRSGRELRDHLVGKEHDKTTVDQVIGDLTAKGLLSDGDFAGAWIRDRQNLKPRSKRRLEQELRQKGLEPAVISEALSGISEQDEREALAAIIRRKQAQAKYQDERKLVQYLVAQGFSYQLIKAVLAERLE
ncbi:MAG TPA: RecX family transcriptional regulator [Candidatus Saccharimonadales bacterium]|nr:RecX family transcriptional regulator [Candidatus Saccharimonadales bacterium]